MKQWLTAREIAEAAARLRLTCLPRTKRGVQDLAEREGWAACRDLCRDREGRGGGREYHVSLLPEALKAALQSEAARATVSASHAIRAEGARKRLQALSTTSLTARQRAVMEARAAVLVAIDGYRIMNGASARQAFADFARDPSAFEVDEPTLVRANDRPNVDRNISLRTLQRWAQLREELGVGALAPLATKERHSLPPGFSDFLRFYALPSKPCAAEALRNYRKEITDPRLDLTIDQVRHILKVKLDNIEKHVGREGFLTLKARLAYVQRSTENLWPTTIYTADGKTFDAEVAHPVGGKPFKPEITTVADVATRRIVGFAVSLKENTIAVTEALRIACVDHGIPAIFYVDRGPGYRNRTFDCDATGMMGRLSITKMHSLPYNSQGRGVIERIHKTVWNPLARTLPTYLGEEMDREAAKAVHQRTRRDIRMFGHSRLLTPWEDFRQKCAGAIADYNAAPHSSLPEFEDPATGRRRHMSPDELWADHVARGFEPVPVEAELVDDLFRPYEIRTVRRALIEWNSNTYFHRDLEPLHGSRVMVGYDFADAKRLWVRAIDLVDGAEAPGRLICVAEFGGNRVDYVPKSFQRAAEERRARGRLRLLGRRVADVEAELSPAALLEQRAEEPVEMIDLAPAPDAEPAANVATLPLESRRRGFASDEALAAWALDHPDKLSANQLRVLREAMQRPATLELFRLSGIDTERLRTVIRAAA